MTDTYQLAIIRFRWGHDNNSGSEHAINDQNYPLEVIHFSIKEDTSLLRVDYSEKGFFFNLPRFPFRLLFFFLSGLALDFKRYLYLPDSAVSSFDYSPSTLFFLVVG